MIITLSYMDVEIILGFDMTYGCGPIDWVKRAGFTKIKRKKISEISDWLIHNVIEPIREESSELLEESNANLKLCPITKEVELHDDWVKTIYELLHVGLRVAEEEKDFWDLKVMCGHDLKEITSCYIKFKEAISLVK